MKKKKRKSGIDKSNTEKVKKIEGPRLGIFFIKKIA
jgi:hypothetical protein